MYVVFTRRFMGSNKLLERGSLSSAPIHSHLVFKIPGLIPRSFSITQLQIYSLYSFMLMTFLSPGEAQLRSSPSSNTSATHLLFVISGILTIFWELKSLLSQILFILVSKNIYKTCYIELTWLMPNQYAHLDLSSSNFLLLMEILFQMLPYIEALLEHFNTLPSPVQTLHLL